MVMLNYNMTSKSSKKHSKKDNPIIGIYIHSNLDTGEERRYVIRKYPEVTREMVLKRGVEIGKKIMREKIKNKPQTSFFN